jgi:hypothetical protein
MCVIQTSNVYVPFEKVAENGGLGGLFSAPSPPSSEGPILAPRALSPKWTSLYLPCAMARGIIGLLSRTAKLVTRRKIP